MALFKEFREFALKGNVVDLAIAVIIGAAYFIILPALVGLLVGRVNLISTLIQGVGLALLISAMIARMRI